MIPWLHFRVQSAELALSRPLRKLTRPGTEPLLQPPNRCGRPLFKKKKLAYGKARILDLKKGEEKKVKKSTGKVKIKKNRLKSQKKIQKNQKMTKKKVNHRPQLEEVKKWSQKKVEKSL